MMLIPIYKKTETSFQQQFINQGEDVPIGWTTNLDELDFEKEPSEMELIKEENKLLRTKIEKQEEDITNTQMAITDIFEMVEKLA